VSKTDMPGLSYIHRDSRKLLFDCIVKISPDKMRHNVLHIVCQKRDNFPPPPLFLTKIMTAPSDMMNKKHGIVPIISLTFSIFALNYML
jgi:hypothetical protein